MDSRIECKYTFVSPNRKADKTKKRKREKKKMKRGGIEEVIVQSS
jgi:hypothetical protein